VIGRSQRARDESGLADFPFKKRTLSHANPGILEFQKNMPTMPRRQERQRVGLEFKL
jgi:hypothetical protein